MKPLPELTASTVGPDTGSAAGRAAPASPGVTTNIAGTARLVRLALRRDRAKLPIWLLGTTVLLAVSLSATREQYPTEADRLDVLRSAADSPALLLMRTAPTGAGTGRSGDVPGAHAPRRARGLHEHPGGRAPHPAERGRPAARR